MPPNNPAPSDPQDETNRTPVPQDLARAGRDTNEPYDDSPESLDADQQTVEGESLFTPLAEDNDTPFSPAADPVDDPSAGPEQSEQDGRLNPMHQATDNATNIDLQELYDEGLSGAAEAEEPNLNDAVIGYNPQKDQRR